MIRLNIKCLLLRTLFAFFIVLLLTLETFADSTIILPPQNFNSSAPLATATNTKLGDQAQEAARLLGIEEQVQKLLSLKASGKLDAYSPETVKLQLSVTRKVMTAGLELRKTSAKLDREIIFEQQAEDKLLRDRDFAVAVTNNANFLQLNILSMIIDGPLEESHDSRRVLAGNQLNIVSGLTVGGLAGLAFLEQRGGVRSAKNPARPNLLGQPLGLEAPAEEQLPPLLWKYLNSPAPDYAHTPLLTRREQLIEYWKTAKVLSINLKKQSDIEKISVLGAHHGRRCESIKLISDRIMMLFDLRAMVDHLNAGLVDLMQGID